jgi:nicotinamide-nucleotide amidase
MHQLIDKMAQDVVQLLSEKKLMLSTAESCTGGLLSGAITGVAGSSKVLGLGICAYGDQFKEYMLGVSKETLEKHGATSAECAAEMAVGIRKASDADVGISITGIAGPTGGTPEKPIGTVYLACSYKDKLNPITIGINAEQDRQYIRLESVIQALMLILNTIEE